MLLLIFGSSKPSDCGYRIPHIGYLEIISVPGSVVLTFKDQKYCLSLDCADALAVPFSQAVSYDSWCTHGGIMYKYINF